MKKKHPLILLLYAVLFFVMGGILAVGVKAGLEAAGIKETLPGKAIQLVLQISFITVFYKLYLRKHESCGLEREYPRKGRMRSIAIGLAVGAGLISLQVAFFTAAGLYRISSFMPDVEVVKYLFLMIMIGFIEELATRGILFRLVEKWAGSIAALAVVTVEGALTHATNPNSTLWSSIAVGLEFGILMSLVYMTTRNLWTVSALHFAWNFTMGGVFDIAVSGTESQSIFKAVLSGPAWLTGGAFGIEAGTPAVVLTILLSTILVIKLKNNNGFRRRE